MDVPNGWNMENGGKALRRTFQLEDFGNGGEGWHQWIRSYRT